MIKLEIKKYNSLTERFFTDYYEIPVKKCSINWLIKIFGHRIKKPPK